MNPMVLLIIPLALHDSDASAKSVNDWKSHGVSDFDNLELANEMMVLMILPGSCNASDGIT